MDALAVRGDEGRRSLRKVTGSWQANIDPSMSEWGNPSAFSRYLIAEYIGIEKQTRRTETSKYPEEKKSTEIPLVAVSESGRALKLMDT